MLSFLLAIVMPVVPLEEIAPVLSEHALPKYSNDERSLAYLAPDDRGAYNLYVDGKRLTHTRRAISNFFWEKDDAHLLYLYDEKGDENHHLYRTDLVGTSEDLTPFPDVRVEFIGVNKAHALIKMNLRDPRYMDCYHLDLETKEISPLYPQINHRVHIRAGDNLKPRVCMNFEPTGQKFLEVYEGDGWRPLWTLDPEDWNADVLGLTPDKQKVIVLSSTGLPARGVYAVDLQTGARELWFSHPKLDCLKAYSKNGKLQAACVRDGRLEWHFFDQEFQEDIQTIEKKLCQGEVVGEVVLLARLSKDRKWFVAHRQDDHPTAYYLFDRTTKGLQLSLQEAPELLRYTFGKMETFHFQASDGQEIQGYFLTPPCGNPPYPTILQAHGGPHLRDTWGFLPQSQYWASRGYASLFINFRGSSGFGTRFTMADVGEWGRRVSQDLIDGKHWAENQGWVDPQRTIIKGGSYGGYLALLGISLTPFEFMGGIADFPIVEPSTWKPQASVVWAFTYDKWYRKAAIGAKSPLSYAHQIQVPLLMMHSENDLRVGLSQSQKMAEALRFNQVPFTYHVLPGDGHGYLDPDNRRFYFNEVEAFLSKQFGATLKIAQ